MHSCPNRAFPSSPRTFIVLCRFMHARNLKAAYHLHYSHSNYLPTYSNDIITTIIINAVASPSAPRPMKGAIVFRKTGSLSNNNRPLHRPPWQHGRYFCPTNMIPLQIQTLNYRPISLTSVVIKLCENIIGNKLDEFLEAKQLITENQHRQYKTRQRPLNNH